MDFLLATWTEHVANFLWLRKLIKRQRETSSYRCPDQWLTNTHVQASLSKATQRKRINSIYKISVGSVTWSFGLWPKWYIDVRKRKVANYGKHKNPSRKGMIGLTIPAEPGEKSERFFDFSPISAIRMTLSILSKSGIAVTLIQKNCIYPLSW